MKKSIGLAVLVCALGLAMQASAADYNQEITAIFGSGNPDTGWTVVSTDEVTLALRAKNRETASTANVNGVYSEPTGYQAPNNNRARWNWELSIEVKDGVLTDYDYYVEIDGDPSTAVDIQTVNVLSFWNDNSYGTSDTANGQGVEGPSAIYAGSSTIAQQSQNIVFLPLPQDPTQNATYTYTLYAVAAGADPDGERIASVSITVVVGTGGVQDDDGDGVLNSNDQCPNTESGDVVNTQGCSIQDLLNNCASGSQNHGQYVSCVVELANSLYKSGQINQAQRKELVTAAAQSNIGK